MKRQSVRNNNTDTKQDTSELESIGFFSFKDLSGLVFVVFLMMLTSIFVSHYVEGHKVYYKNLKKEVRDLKWTSKQLKVDLSIQGNPEVVKSKLVGTTDLEPMKEPAKSILYNPSKYGK